ncbi:MAG: EAL domain-containing protein [Nannocystaceae bacterium]|nr:EAL domain-containing protein [Nannocystaceae bacterium]
MDGTPMTDTATTSPGTVLVVDDEPLLCSVISRALQRRGIHTHAATDVATALAIVERGGIEAVVSDIAMPGRDGLDLLRAVRAHDLDLPVLLMTGAPDLDSAITAVELGALKYVTKPFETSILVDSVQRAMNLYRLARAKREVMALVGGPLGEGSDRTGLETSFERALSQLWMAYQPIVRADGSVYGHEALLRSDEPALPNPGAILDAASRLGRLPQLSETIRQRVATDLGSDRPPWSLFLNLHPHDLLDPSLFSGQALAGLREGLVLEITERAALDDIADVATRVDRLRTRGHRIAIDDLGAGYSGLSSFLHLRPEVVKLDMNLTRGIDRDPMRRKLVASITAMCHELGTLVVAEGIETAAERDTLVALECDLLQGYFFARPARVRP